MLLEFVLFEPKAHFHLAVHRGRRGEMFTGGFRLPIAPMVLAQADMTMGDQRPHAVLLRELQRLLVMSDDAHRIEAVGMGGNVAEEVPGMGREARLAL